MANSTIQIEDSITVGALAEQLMLPVTRLITELMKNGVLATVNEVIDFETAQIIVEELGLEIELTRKEAIDTFAEKKEKRKQNNTGETRPPVIAVMGHVDHGKTSLLDAIRSADTTKHEAGGITQHISAYQITHKDRKMTFLDTPGHEAFAALREHGAQLTDLVIIVIAADDGIKPQTIEAIRFARKAGVKMLVAVNKIDKEGADTNRIKQQLSEQDLLVEEWGGDTVVVEVSAKAKTGIDELLDMALLLADVEELKADKNVAARGLIIEAHMEQGRGPVAVCLVDEGTLKPGEYVVTGTTYAKVRNLETTLLDPIKEAGPSTPVLITGFKALPGFGDEFFVVKDEKEARKLAADSTQAGKNSNQRQDIKSTELLRIINRSNQVTELPLIIKADVQGSLTSVIDSLKSLDTDEVQVRVVASGVGAITESDIHTASTSHAHIYGFNVDLPTNVKRLANRDQTALGLYKVIYELIDDVKLELTKLLAPEIVETELGTLSIKGVFKTTKTEIICGGEVLKGKLSLPALAKIMRGKEELGEATVTNLKRGPQDTKEVFEGDMCGVELATTSRIEVVEGDRIIFFKREQVTRQL